MTKRALFLSLVALLITFFGAQVAFAQSDVTDDEVNDIAKQLFCPTCEAIPVDVCPTEVCSDWRAEIRSQLEAGRSEREILDYFADRYGSGVLSTPPPQGIGLVVYIAPVVIAILGAWIFYTQMSKLQAKESTSMATTVGAVIHPDPVNSADDKDLDQDDYRRRLEEELK
ncbi:MAG: cytochrome c-type biogenesis protein CcmH [Chloroflexota bacterium]